MLSGKLPTGTVGAGAGTDRRGSDCDATPRGPGERGRERTDDRGGRGADGVACDRPSAGADRDSAPATRGRPRGGSPRTDPEPRLAAERRRVIDRYERLLAERTGGESGATRRAEWAHTTPGRVRAWFRRACCRLRLRLSRRG